MSDYLPTGADLVRAAKLLRGHAATIKLSEFNFHSKRWDDVSAHDEWIEHRDLARKLDALAEARVRPRMTLTQAKARARTNASERGAAFYVVATDNGLRVTLEPSQDARILFEAKPRRHS